MLGEQGDGARELVAGGVGATDEHRDGHALELLGVEPIARLLGRDQVGQQVVGRCHTPSLDELVHVRAHLGLRGLDEWQVFEDVVVEDSQQVRRPPTEQLPVLFRRAQQTADDRDGIGLAHVGHELAAPSAGKRVDEPVDDLAHVGPQTVGRLGGERGGDQAAQPRVLIAFGREDRRSARLHRAGIESHHLREPGEGLVPAPIAEEGDAVLVPQDRVPAVDARDPALLAGVHEEALALRLRACRQDVDRRDVELVDRRGHDHQRTRRVTARSS